MKNVSLEKINGSKRKGELIQNKTANKREQRRKLPIGERTVTEEPEEQNETEEPEEQIETEEV